MEPTQEFSGQVVLPLLAEKEHPLLGNKYVYNHLLSFYINVTFLCKFNTVLNYRVSAVILIPGGMTDPDATK